MQEALGIVIFVVVIGGAVVAVITLLGSGEAYKQIGRGGLSIDTDERPRAGGGSGPEAAGPQGTPAERDAEIRQMLTARNERRARRGAAPLDIEDELARLHAPTGAGGSSIDPGLRDEVRQMVMARNARRVRTGKEPLDVEAEVERQLRDLT